MPGASVTSLGKSLRFRRLVGADSRILMIPMDHGASVGPIPGIERVDEAVARVRDGGATCVVLHKGLVRDAAPALGSLGLLVHLSASTGLNPDPNDKRIVGTVEEVVRAGADGVSVHVNVGAETESRMVEDLGRVATECDRHGMPLLAMMYPRGKDIRDPHHVDMVKQVARLGAELGADIVKCPYTGSVETFREVVRGCARPVIVSGGPKTGSDRGLLEMVRGAIDAGAAGVSIGRNVWQHRAPTAMTRALRAVIFEKADVDQAIRIVEKG